MAAEHETCTHSDSPYCLGLDLGVQSIGWAVIDLDQNDQPCGLRRAGVRCFDVAAEKPERYEEGREEPANQKRRVARVHRRQLWRRSRRRRKVVRLLQGAGFLPAGAAQTPVERHGVLQKLDADLQQSLPADGHAAAQLLPYRLRAKALDAALQPFALGRALFHLAQRRGFLSNRKARKEDEDVGKVKAGIASLYAEMEATGARTIGELFAGLDPEQTRIRGRWTARRMFLDEFEAIWAAQSPHHAGLTDSLKEELHRAIFFQRPLKSQKHLIGRCDLEPRCRRAPIACLDFQRFRYLQRVNDLEIIAPDGEILLLTAEQRRALVEALENHAELSFARVRAVLGLRVPRGSTPYEFNLERGGEKKLLGNRTAAKMAEAIPERWPEMSGDDRSRLVDEILSFANEEALANRLQRAWGFSKTEAKAAADMALEGGYGSLSRRAIRRLLPHLEPGTRLNMARKEVYGDQLLATQAADLLPPVRAASRQLRNPTVTRALTELRKVVNALVRQYGKPKRVRVELAREMKRSREQRKRVSQQMRDQETERDHAREQIRAKRKLGIADPGPTDILKFRLAEECNWECPYSGKSICMEALFGATPQFDIEHIIPFARSLDNSYLNKTLCYHEENRNRKGNRTPFEAYGHDADRWSALLARVRKFQGSAAASKLRKFQLEEVPGDFAQAQLSDTRYISRLAADYLGLLYGGGVDAEGHRRIQVNAGGVTAFLRDQWNLNAILGDGGQKNRDDHRHHAVDAVAIALCSPATICQLSTAADAAYRLRKRLFTEVPPPWNGFLDDVRRAIDDVNVSFRVNRRVRGALHRETNYSKVHRIIDHRGQMREYRHVRKRLENLSAKEVAEIVDDRVREAVQEKLAAAGGNVRRAFSDANEHPYLRARDGRVIPIRKVRIREAMSTGLELGGKHAPRFVAPGSNHHMEIVAVLDDQGIEERWTWEPISLFDAAQRLRRREPVIRHDHEAGFLFKFSLAKGEFVEMTYKEPVRRLYRVTGISEGEIAFVLHTDARPAKLRRGAGERRVRARSAGDLLRFDARKVLIDPLGNVLPAND